MRTAKNWLITGCSSGFGFHLAQLLLDQNQNVIATARRLEPLDELKPSGTSQLLKLQLDVTDSDSIAKATQNAVSHFNTIDVLINNAGYGQMGVLEEVSEADIRSQFETNVFGLIQVTKAVLPHMRAKKSGTILNLSSIAGLASFGGVGIYCASKHAVEAISEALEQEVKPFGIKVHLIEPGAFRTRFHNTKSVQIPKNTISDYASDSEGLVQRMADFDGQQDGDPVKAAQAMIDIVDSPDAPFRLLLGSDAYERAMKKIQNLSQEFERNAELSQSMSVNS